MTKLFSRYQILLPRFVILLVIAFSISGLVLFGFSGQGPGFIWENLMGRHEGPMTFRYCLQPIIGAIAAWQGALIDVRTGRSPFLWGAITDPAERRKRFDEVMVATSSIILLGLTMDIV